MKFVLAKKISMTQKFAEDGKVTPVTAVLVGNNVVTQIRNEDRDGYTAVQIGSGKRNKIKKSLKGHLKGNGDVAILREFRVPAEEIGEIKEGNQIDLESFEKGDKLRVVGDAKGKGFQGVVKRHGFHGQDKTHGNKDQLRMPGSIGATGPARVFKGMRMGGHMGTQQVTLKGLEIIDIDIEKGILYIKGALPGARNSWLKISADGELKFIEKKTNTAKKDESELEGKTEENKEKVEDLKEKEVEAKEAKEGKKEESAKKDDKNKSDKTE